MFSYDNNTNGHGFSNALIQPCSIDGRMVTLPGNDPSLITIKSYLNAVERLNRLPMDPKREWIFHSGMLFQSNLKWWPKGTRATCHEGVDILFYRHRNGSIASVPCDLLVPALSGGTILNICDDFLGKSVIVDLCKTGKSYRHNNVFKTKKTKNLKTVENLCQSTVQRSQRQMSKKGDETKALIYSHILPDPSLAIGQSITKGQILGRIADTSMKKSGISAHLHLSFMSISKRIAPSQLNWQLFTNHNQEAIQFYDPMTIRLKYSSDGDLEVIF